VFLFFATAGAKWYSFATFVNQAAKFASQLGGDMKARTIVLTLALCFIGAAVCFAQSPFMGTWKLNEAKSTLSPGTPKNNSVVYETEGLNVKITIEGTDGAGNQTHNEWTGQFDGKDYPVKGDPNSDSRSYTRKGIHELDFVVKKGTTVTTSGRIVVSDDGKSRTVTSTGTDANGKKFKSTAVYDMQ
jgi:hypothetical protein